MEGIEEAKKRIRHCLEAGEGELDLSELGISDLDQLQELKKCTHLKTLELGNNKITNLEPLSELTSLTYLSLLDNQIVNFKPLSGLNSLTYLSVTDNQIVSLESLSGLNSLTSLALSNNQIVNLEPLSKFNFLTHLWLSNNQIVNLEPISGLTSLNVLWLGNNEIVSLEPLSGLKSLTELWLDHNQIVNLEPLAGLNSLFFLELGNNEIVDLEPLSWLNSLFDLFIYNNQIVDFRPLLKLDPYVLDKIIVLTSGNPNEILNDVVKQGYNALKAYYDEKNREGSILTDMLKVIVLGNSTAGKTSLVKYWGNKIFDEKQITTHGIYTPMDIPLEDEPIRVNVWDFGGQDYYHATHRLFITADSTFVLVCANGLENKPEEELTKEYFLEEGELTEKEMKIRHYPYMYWIQTLKHLTRAGEWDPKMPIFLVENKCGLYPEGDNLRMRLTEENKKKIPFEITGNDFFHLDIRKTWEFFQNPLENLGSAAYADEYQKFEKSLLGTLRKQVKESRYEIISYFPEVRDTLEKLAEWKQSQQVSSELNELLEENKIDRIERYEKLPVWISYSQYQDIVYRARKVKDGEPPWEALHIYLQNICGRIFHFKHTEELGKIVFIDPNWLHQTIYKVLSPEVLKNKGEFTLQEADNVIDGDILDAATFLDAMKAFELVFEIPEQTPRRFIAPQYLPQECPLSSGQLKKYREQYHILSLILEFPEYLPPSLISRLISLKGHLIKDQEEPLWRNGVIYSEKEVSTFVLCHPQERKIEIYLGRGADEPKNQQVLRHFMEHMEDHFSEDMHEMLISLPGISGKVKWKHLYSSKESGLYAAKDYSSPDGRGMTGTEPFAFLAPDFERKPVRVFICYSHEDSSAMKEFTTELQKQFRSFFVQTGTEILPFSDLELKVGDHWDTVLQDNISKADVLICLLSSGFFTSSYIQNKEYGRVFRELSEGNRNTLIAPVYFKSCYISDINKIRSIQFYEPKASDFELPNIKDFSFVNLVAQDKSRIPNYVTGLVKQLTEKLDETRKKR